MGKKRGFSLASSWLEEYKKKLELQRVEHFEKIYTAKLIPPPEQMLQTRKIRKERKTQQMTQMMILNMIDNMYNDSKSFVIFTLSLR